METETWRRGTDWVPLKREMVRGLGVKKGETWKRGGGNGVCFNGGGGVGVDGVEEEVKNVLHDLGVQE